jgi:hypothetical protein
MFHIIINMSHHKIPVVGWYGAHLVCQRLFSLLHQHKMMDDDECGPVGAITGKWKIKYSEKTWPNAACRFLQEPHGVTSQKILFIVTTMKASNLT